MPRLFGWNIALAVEHMAREGGMRLGEVVVVGAQNTWRRSFSMLLPETFDYFVSHHDLSMLLPEKDQI